MLQVIGEKFSLVKNTPPNPVHLSNYLKKETRNVAMKNRFRNSTLFMLVVATSVIASCSRRNPEPGHWTVTAAAENKTAIAWARFYWSNDSLGDRYYEKTAMHIPLRIEGLPYLFSFQFDLGCDLTTLYGENAKSVKQKHPAADLEKPAFTFGDLKANTPYCYIRESYGDPITLDTPANITPVTLGTIGADMFQGKVLIIDYPNERFSVCDTIPPALITTMTDITLDKHGRALLPMQLNGKNFKVLFDNGSSIFQLITAASLIDRFSKEPGMDTIRISSWGKLHNVIGRPLKDSFVLAGRHLANTMIYADYRENDGKDEFDAITGNALFFDKVVVIDFKNKKFGVKDL